MIIFSLPLSPVDIDVVVGVVVVVIVVVLVTLVEDDVGVVLVSGCAG